MKESTRYLESDFVVWLRVLTSISWEIIASPSTWTWNLWNVIETKYGIKNTNVSSEWMMGNWNRLKEVTLDERWDSWVGIPQNSWFYQQSRRANQEQSRYMEKKMRKIRLSLFHPSVYSKSSRDFRNPIRAANRKAKEKGKVWSRLLIECTLQIQQLLSWYICLIFNAHKAHISLWLHLPNA